jgi:hypothetical protein
MTSVKFEAVHLHLTENGMYLALDLSGEPTKIIKSYFTLHMEQRLSKFVSWMTAKSQLGTE